MTEDVYFYGHFKFLKDCKPNVPQKITCGLVSIGSISSISSYSSRYYFLNTKGELFTLSENNAIPAKVKCSKKVKMVSSGHEYACFVTTDNDFYSLGYRNCCKYNTKLSETSFTVPIKVSSLSGKDIESISVGNSHVAVLLSTGSVYLFGSGVEGQLGVFSKIPRNDPNYNKEVYILQQSTPKTLYEKYKIVRAGGKYTSFVDICGGLLVSGEGVCGVTAQGDFRNIYYPQKAMFDVKKYCKKSSKKVVMKMEVNEDLSLNCDYKTVIENVEKEEETNPKILNIACGYNHQICLSKDNELFATGLNNVGQCAQNNTKSLNKLTKINFPNNKSRVVKIGAGQSYSGVLCEHKNNKKSLWVSGHIDSTVNLMFTKVRINGVIKKVFFCGKGIFIVTTKLS